MPLQDQTSSLFSIFTAHFRCLYKTKPHHCFLFLPHIYCVVYIFPRLYSVYCPCSKRTYNCTDARHASYSCQDIPSAEVKHRCRCSCISEFLFLLISKRGKRMKTVKKNRYYHGEKLPHGSFRREGIVS